MHKKKILVFLLVMISFFHGDLFAGEEVEYGTSLCKIPRCDELSQENHLYIMNAEKLGLSDEQVRKLGEIKSECDREFVIDRDNLRTAKLELDALLKSDKIDMVKIGEKSREISDLLHKVTIKRVKTKVKSMMILTDRQKEKAKRLFMDQPSKN